MKTSDLKVYLGKIGKAKNISKKLAAQSKEFALFVQENMEDQGVGELMGGKYLLKTIVSSVGKDTSLHLNISEQYRDFDVMLDTKQLSSTNDLDYIFNDMRAGFHLPSFENVLTFLNDAEELLEELASFNTNLKFPKIG